MSSGNGDLSLGHFKDRPLRPYASQSTIKDNQARLCSLSRDRVWLWLWYWLLLLGINCHVVTISSCCRHKFHAAAACATEAEAAAAATDILRCNMQIINSIIRCTHESLSLLNCASGANNAWRCNNSANYGACSMCRLGRRLRCGQGQ